MDEATIAKYLTSAFEDIQVETLDGSLFFFCGAERQMPIVTLVTKDSYDDFSDLNRPGIYRLNIGLAKATFVSLLGEQTEKPDFKALDRLMPHPVYGSMFWVCVLNPSVATFENIIKPLLAEACERAAGRRAQRANS